jgi:uncharacterized protein YndB with AHSA1/START domain
LWHIEKKIFIIAVYMEAFELKIAVDAGLRKVFAVVTDPKWVVKWDTAKWVLNDMYPGGALRKRDEDGILAVGEVVVFRTPSRYAYVWPVPTDPDDPGDDTFPVRFEFSIDGHGEKSLLTLTGTGFPTPDLAEREKNSWGGYFLEKIKKVAEGIPAKDLEQASSQETKQGHVRRTERATQFD